MSMLARYPNYEFLWHNNTAEKVKNRHGAKAFKDFVTELHLLAHSDYLVCTFSSNVSISSYAAVLVALKAESGSMFLSGTLAVTFGNANFTSTYYFHNHCSYFSILHTVHTLVYFSIAA